MIKIREKILREFDVYVRGLDISDELFRYWLQYGISDGADEKIIHDFAKSDMKWDEVVQVFAQICREAGVI